MKTPLQMAYNSLNKPRAGITKEGEIFVKGKGTYHKRDRLKKLGGRWNADGKYWTVPTVADALSVGALFRFKARVEAHCHMKERDVYVTHEEAIAGINRMGCPMCDTSFRYGDNVKILEIYDEIGLLEEIKEYKKQNKGMTGIDR